MSGGILTSPYTGTRWLFATDLAILNHGQVTKTTPKLEPSSLNFKTTPKGGRLSFNRFHVHRVHPSFTIVLQRYYHWRS
ncbi:hypothetical protein TNCV_851651 [Trichonephila clavipes]|nr:hypothetical protein TNCV_851651 [Trichonephila clavipes]